MVKKLKQAHDERIEKEKLKKEMDIARQIQQRLLPRNYPEVEGIEFAALFEPAQEIGGDFYDVFPIDENRLGFAIGDVAGKSISGALLMVLVRTLLRAEALNRSDPREVLARLNNFLRAELAEDRRRFVTLQYNVIDIKARSVTCTSAGHPPPIFMSASGKTIETVHTKGIALGVVEDSRFFKTLVEKKVKLTPGDALLLYTDGITDVAYKKGGGFGEEGLIKSLRDCCTKNTHDILSCVMHDLTSYAGAVPIEDDLTMLLIKGK